MILQDLLLRFTNRNFSKTNINTNYSVDVGKFIHYI